MKTEPTEAGDQGVIPDHALRRRVPKRAKAGGGNLDGTPLGKRETIQQGELFASAEDEPSVKERR